MNKIEYATIHATINEEQFLKINSAVSNATTSDTLNISSAQCTSEAIDIIDIDTDESWQTNEEDPRSDSLTIYSDLHTDSSSESDDEVASFNYELLNYEISENEQNEYTHLAASESSLEDIEDNDPEKATSELKNFLRNWAIINGVKSCAVSDLLSH